jgi:hypothetical protein
VPYPFQWGAPTFDAGEAFAMMAASFVALVEVCYLYKPMMFLQLMGLHIIFKLNAPYCMMMQSTGAFIAVSRYASATPCPPSVLSRGIGWQVCIRKYRMTSGN